jgi:hypothetical protein
MYCSSEWVTGQTTATILATIGGTLACARMPALVVMVSLGGPAVHHPAITAGYLIDVIS